MRREVTETVNSPSGNSWVNIFNTWAATEDDLFVREIKTLSPFCTSESQFWVPYSLEALEDVDPRIADFVRYVVRVADISANSASQGLWSLAPAPLGAYLGMSFSLNETFYDEIQQRLLKLPAWFRAEMRGVHA